MPGYVTIRRFDHYGEVGVPTGKVNEETGEAEFIMLDCKHGGHRLWFKPEDLMKK
jgi:hypothetical protein